MLKVLSFFGEHFKTVQGAPRKNFVVPEALVRNHCARSLKMKINLSGRKFQTLQPDIATYKNIHHSKIFKLYQFLGGNKNACFTQGFIHSAIKMGGP